MPFDGGPYVQAACLCDYVLQDNTGAFSLIRVVDTITHREVGPEPPVEMPPVSFTFKLVLMLKSGMARGRHELRISPELPTGEQLDPLTISVHFEGEEKGANMVLDLRQSLSYEGLYWFHILLDDEQLTAIPLRVKYERVVITSNPQSR